MYPPWLAALDSARDAAMVDVLRNGRTRSAPRLAPGCIVRRSIGRFGCVLLLALPLKAYARLARRQRACGAELAAVIEQVGRPLQLTAVGRPRLGSTAAAASVAADPTDDAPSPLPEGSAATMTKPGAPTAPRASSQPSTISRHPPAARSGAPATGPPAVPGSLPTLLTMAAVMSPLISSRPAFFPWWPLPWICFPAARTAAAPATAARWCASLEWLTTPARRGSPC